MLEEHAQVALACPLPALGTDPALAARQPPRSPHAASSDRSACALSAQGGFHGVPQCQDARVAAAHASQHQAHGRLPGGMAGN